MVAELESDLIRTRTGDGMTTATAKGRLRGKEPGIVGVTTNTRDTHTKSALEVRHLMPARPPPRDLRPARRPAPGAR